VQNIPDETLKEESGYQDRAVQQHHSSNEEAPAPWLAADVYKQLDRLREFRNRIRIQFDDVPAVVGRDDSKALTAAVLSRA
jgi:hypothetical protein